MHSGQICIAINRIIIDRKALLPPNSSAGFFKFFVASAPICWPAFVEPVKDILVELGARQKNRLFLQDLQQ